MIHFVLVAILKLILESVPRVNNEMSWTLINLTYMAVGLIVVFALIQCSYLMFHYVKGIPFEYNSGAYDTLTMWEQIDNGQQYTPSKKFLTFFPILLFLVSTHYTKYNVWMFAVNFWALMLVTIPKLPQTHRMRIFGVNKFDFNEPEEIDESGTGVFNR